MNSLPVRPECPPHRAALSTAALSWNRAGQRQRQGGWAGMTGPLLRSVQPLFASPLLRFVVPEAAAMNARIMAQVAAMRVASPGLARSNQHGWHSALDFFERAEPGCAALRGHILVAAREAALALAPGFDLATVAVQAEGWINVNGPGAYNAPHEHPGWTFSGTYYVSMPTMSEGRGGAG